MTSAKPNKFSRVLDQNLIPPRLPLFLPDLSIMRIGVVLRPHFSERYTHASLKTHRTFTYTNPAIRICTKLSSFKPIMINDGARGTACEEFHSCPRRKRPSSNRRIKAVRLRHANPWVGQVAKMSLCPPSKLSRSSKGRHFIWLAEDNDGRAAKAKH
jgi:hypothetical protein